MKKLILFMGDLAALKSTTAKKISKDLNIVCFTKDDIKEILVDSIGFQTREENLKLSKATFFLMKYLSEQFLNHSNALILESNFKYHELDILSQNKEFDFFTVFMSGQVDVLYERYCQRQGQRHIAHRSVSLMSKEIFQQSMMTYNEASLLGQTIKIDTSDFNEDTYQHILVKIKDFLEQ
jgi:predicted kinase